MTAYIYKARDMTGKGVRGRMVARTKEELADKLEKMGYMTTQVIEALPEIRIPALWAIARPKGEALLVFYHQLANMIKAGIGILSCLAVLEKQTASRTLRNAIGELGRDIEAGESLSGAMAKHPRIFPKLFVSMVRSGEASGKLDRILKSYARYAEGEHDLREKIRTALVYPLILLGAGIGVSLFIVSHIIPQFAQIFLRAGVELPAPTRCLYATGMWIRGYWPWVLGGAAAVLSASRIARRTQTGAAVIDRVKLGLPVAGALFRRVAVSRFAKTLAVLIGSGVPILEALELTAEVIGNRVLGSAVLTARSSVERGERIGESLKVSGEFPPDAVHMVIAGEESGGLDEMLEKVSELYDMHVGYAVKKLTSVFEPFLLALMGVMVGAIMLSTLLPIFEMIKIIR